MGLSGHAATRLVQAGNQRRVAGTQTTCAKSNQPKQCYFPAQDHPELKEIMHHPWNLPCVLCHKIVYFFPA